MFIDILAFVGGMSTGIVLCHWGRVVRCELARARREDRTRRAIIEYVEEVNKANS